MLTTHPCISRCLGVKSLCFEMMSHDFDQSLQNIARRRTCNTLDIAALNCEILLFGDQHCFWERWYHSKSMQGHMDDLKMIIILPVRRDWLIGHFARPAVPLLVSVWEPATFTETSLTEYGSQFSHWCTLWLSGDDKSLFEMIVSNSVNHHQTVCELLGLLLLTWINSNTNLDK